MKYCTKKKVIACIVGYMLIGNYPLSEIKVNDNPIRDSSMISEKIEENELEAIIREEVSFNSRILKD